MTCYLVQPKDRIFMKSSGFLSFAKNMSKNISEKLSSKYSQKSLAHAKQSASYEHKTESKRAIQKTAGTSGDLIGNKIPDTITKVFATE